MNIYRGMIEINPLENDNIERIEYVINTFIFPGENLCFENNTMLINIEGNFPNMEEEMNNLRRYWNMDIVFAAVSELSETEVNHYQIQDGQFSSRTRELVA